MRRVVIIPLWGLFFLFGYAGAENLIKNPGFEEINGFWTDSSATVGGSALINDSTYFHSGKYSGMTDATNGDTGFPIASLSQSLANVEISELNQKNNLHWWYKISDRATEVGPSFFVRILGADVAKKRCDLLYYWYNAPNAELPWDTTYYIGEELYTLKFLSAGSFDDTTGWNYEERNFYDDWTGRGFPATAVLREISLFSEGWIDPVSEIHYGQRVQWDDFWLGEPVSIEEKVGDTARDFRVWPKITKWFVNYRSEKPVSTYDSNGRLLERKEKGTGTIFLKGSGIYFFKSANKIEKIILIR